MLAGDTLMFLMAATRDGGCWDTVPCFADPESCILVRLIPSTSWPYLLVMAKFIPGINTMAPPLAGA